MISQTSAGLVEVAGNGGSPNGWDARTWGLQPEFSVMSITIQVDLPDALVNEAREAGLLESARLADWLADELRRKRARGEFGQMLKKLHSVADEPMSWEEIQAEVDAVREEQRRREGGR